MRKGRFFRRNLRFDPNIDHLHRSSLPLNGLGELGDDLRQTVSDSLQRLQTYTRQHPTNALLLAGAAGITTGLLLWTLIRRSRSHSEAEAIERLEHW